MPAPHALSSAQRGARATGKRGLASAGSAWLRGDGESADGRQGSGLPCCSRPCSLGSVTLLGSLVLSPKARMATAVPCRNGAHLHTFTKSERKEKAAA